MLRYICWESVLLYLSFENKFSHNTKITSPRKVTQVLYIKEKQMYLPKLVLSSFPNGQMLHKDHTLL